MSSKISQGVTTCVAGNCGISLAPFSYKGEVPAPIALLGKSDVFRFPRVNDYKEEFNNKPSSVNLALLFYRSNFKSSKFKPTLNRFFWIITNNF